MEGDFLSGLKDLIDKMPHKVHVQNNNENWNYIMDNDNMGLNFSKIKIYHKPTKTTKFVIEISGDLDVVKKFTEKMKIIPMNEITLVKDIYQIFY